ncbi:hypothetical protein ANO11243_028880 [Dothideomycetidae sp. 11243]|nr:hypothetical protein ANO11243_028880 [fungal sp. No.11243]
MPVIRVPAKVDVDDSRYRGPVVVNPGGPGGSGVDFVARAGRILQGLIQGSLLDSDDEALEFFDVISFDPRGTGQSLPRVECSGSVSDFEIRRIRTMEEGSLNSSDAALGRLWSMAQAVSERCSRVSDNDARTPSGSIQQYLSTAYVARDMLELVEATGRWRQRHLHTARGANVASDPKLERLQYWGLSYGSVLGLTFASMFPDRVGRLVVDGVVGLEDYFAGVSAHHFEDFDKCLATFYEHCARIGYPSCALAARDSPSPAQVEKRTNAIIRNLWHNPLPIIEPIVDVFTWTDIRMTIYTASFSPVVSYPFLADLLAELEKGETTLAGQLISPYHSGHPVKMDLDPFVHLRIRNATLTSNPIDPFVAAAIECTDADPKSHLSKVDFAIHVNEMMASFPAYGDLYASFTLSCYPYRVRPVHRYTGPWHGNTAQPILFVGNTADPATPLQNCYDQAGGYKDAKVLVQDSPGHASLSAYSNCTTSYISEYFRYGSLPENGTVCKPDVIPWGDTVGILSAEERNAAELHGRIGRAMLEAGGGFGF